MPGVRTSYREPQSAEVKLPELGVGSLLAGARHTHSQFRNFLRQFSRVLLHYCQRAELCQLAEVFYLLACRDTTLVSLPQHFIYPLVQALYLPACASDRDHWRRGFMLRHASTIERNSPQTNALVNVSGSASARRSFSDEDALSCPSGNARVDVIEFAAGSRIQPRVR